jgi:hypothetical protein
MSDIFIKRVKLLMEYDLSKTHNENLIISEQYPPNVLYPTNITHPKDATMTSDIYGKQRYSMEKSDIGYSDVKNLPIDWHSALPILSLASFLIPVAGPYLSLGFDLIDAYLYYSEGDNFMAGLMLSLSIIPGDDILKIVSKRYKVSRESIKTLLKKLITKLGKYTEEEIKLMKGIAEEGNEIAKLLRKYLQKKIWKTLFKKMSLKQLITYIWLYSKNNPNKYQIFKLVFKIGITSYTFMQLAQIFGITSKEKKTEENTKTKQVQLEKDYQSNKDTIVTETVDQLIPYSEEQQLLNVKMYLDSAYAN